MSSVIALAVISLPLPVMLLAGVALSRRLRAWEWFAGVVLVLVAAPTSLFATAYFFIGLPLVAIFAALAALMSAWDVTARLTVVSPLVFYALWWIVGAGWVVACPGCAVGDDDRLFVWVAWGLVFASPTALLFLTFDFGRSVSQKLVWNRVSPEV
jgi:hypothetical protein